ncbi:zinc-binding dehydrogenase [Streptomyces sp. NPDC051218]|uniref:zinc-binding dehydrogenase n=1 Tax=Streptomyces sp. NPDC051218 TaxID=3365645 RepID=UPI003796810E
MTTIRAAYAPAVNSDDPLSGLSFGPIAAPEAPGADWVPVRVLASALNHHDLWSLRGVGLAEDQLPMILGCDAAGLDPEGNAVVVHAVIGDATSGDETLDPKRSLLSEKHPGTLAETVHVPRRNLLPKPDALSFTEAACLPTAWLTAYKMLVRQGRITPDSAVLVQGAGGGVATAAVVLARALGARVYATSRSAAKRERIAALGAIALEPGARLPERVDVVVETVGAATFDHSLKCAAPGGRIVVSGTTSGHLAEVDLRRVFFLQLEVIGATMGSRDELADLLRLCARRGIRPVIDSEFVFDDAIAAFARLASGDAFGKVVLDHRR